VTKDRNAGGGGMTGATGDLTPDEAGTDPFVPAETREIADPEHQADVTEAQGGTETNAPAGDRDPRSGGDEVTDHEERF
jgi:hypothetical protein